MLKRNLLRLLVILFAVIIIYFLKDKFSAYNLEKSKKYCKEQVTKQKENY